MTLETTTITGLPNATTPLTGAERVPMDSGSATRDASTQEIANLAGAAIESAIDAHEAAANPHDQYAQTADDLGLGTDDSPVFAGLTITGTAAVAIPHIHGSIAGNLYIHVKNTSGGSLAAGTTVYPTGSVGGTDRIEVAACDPDNPAKMPGIGTLETGLANNGEGNAIVIGELRSFNTSAFSLGAQLYVGAGGAPTATKPISGIRQAVCSVARVHATTGTLIVQIGDMQQTDLASVGLAAGLAIALG
jgi:hypothetical protein